MARDNEYLIEISLSSEKRSKFRHQVKAKYIFSRSFADTITVARGKIEISAFRKSPLPLRDIFTNHTSAIYKQIVRGLCLYYAHARSADAISGIEIKRSLHGVTRDRLAIPKRDLAQIIDRHSDLSLLQPLDRAELDAILDGSPKSNAILYAMTHLLRATATQREAERFEKLWKAFNALYKAKTGNISDHDCHRALRAYIQATPSSFPNAIANIHGLTAPEIRGKVQWVRMVLNSFPSTSHAAAFRDWVLRNEDHRIMEIMRDTLDVRRVHLTGAGLIAAVEGHIASHIASKTVRDSDVLSLLLFKYMYFVRNKLVHAERVDAGFNLVSDHKENSELAWLNKTLASAVVDLINLNKSY